MKESTLEALVENTILFLLLVMIWGVIAWFWCHIALADPVMHSSWSTGDCLYVTAPDGKHSCGWLKPGDTYEQVWEK